MPSFPVLDRKPARPLLGYYLSESSPGILDRIGADWDWIWIDAQHGSLDFRETVDVIRTTHLIGRPGLVRIPSDDPSWIGRILDAGAAGVIVPMVESIAQARHMVKEAKFPPAGNRSYGGRRVIDFKGRGFYRSANAESVLILQVESNEAVAAAEAMAAIDGVDGIFLGPDDLTLRNGTLELPRSRETVGRQCEAVVSACRKHGKLSVISLGVSPEAMAITKDYGFDLICGGSDALFLTVGSQNYSAAWRKLWR